MLSMLALHGNGPRTGVRPRPSSKCATTWPVSLTCPGMGATEKMRWPSRRRTMPRRPESG